MKNSLLAAFFLMRLAVATVDLKHCRCAWAAFDQLSERLEIFEGKPATPVKDRIIPAAWACFKDDIRTDGWSYLEVESNPSVPDWIQAYSAGAVEAYLTHGLMENHWMNLFGYYCSSNRPYCARINRFLTENIAYSYKNQELHRRTDPYWHMVDLQMRQLTGLSDVFENGTLNVRHGLKEPTRALILSAVGDLLDFEATFSRRKDNYGLYVPTCSALIKVAPGSSDIYFGHVTWFVYRSLIKMQKRYRLPWHTPGGYNASGSVVPGHTIAMSSYPGCLNSFDDFHLTSAGLAVMETTLNVPNQALLRRRSPHDGPLTWVRNMVASRLASSGREWAEIFSRFNSGTYNNQWMILDYKLFTPGRSLKLGTLWLLEQLPGKMTANDITDILKDQGFWASYNEAYFREIAVQTRPPGRDRWTNHYRVDPRALTASWLQKEVVDLKTAINFMRYNMWGGWPLELSNCSLPTRTLYFSMSPRFDISRLTASGATDMKVTSYALFQSLEFIGIAGPTSQGVKPFTWSRSPFPSHEHFGQPDVWDFGPVHHQWGQC